MDFQRLGGTRCDSGRLGETKGSLEEVYGCGRVREKVGGRLVKG